MDVIAAGFLLIAAFCVGIGIRRRSNKLRSCPHCLALQKGASAACSVCGEAWV